MEKAPKLFRWRRGRRAQIPKEALFDYERVTQNSSDVIGRWAIEQVVSREPDAGLRRSHRFYLMRRWRAFIQQTFRHGAV